MKRKATISYSTWLDPVFLLILSLDCPKDLRSTWFKYFLTELFFPLILVKTNMVLLNLSDRNQVRILDFLLTLSLDCPKELRSNVLQRFSTELFSR